MNLATAVVSSPITSGGVLVTVPLSFRAVRGARRLAARAAVTWGRPDLEEMTELLTSEIVAVWDDGPGTPKMREAGPLDTSGRGLMLRHALADAHGALLSDDGSKGRRRPHLEPRRRVPGEAGASLSTLRTRQHYSRERGEGRAPPPASPPLQLRA